MNDTYSFEKLRVWNESRSLVKWLYQLTSAFPTDERFGLISQIRRAAVSVVSNLAEGSARTTPKDQARFYQFSYSSLIEVLTQLMISSDLNFITTEKLAEGRKMIDDVEQKQKNRRLKNPQP